MKILITGAAGFIGSALSLRLLARGDEVIGVDNLNDYYDVNLKKARLARTVEPAVEDGSGHVFQIHSSFIDEVGVHPARQRPKAPACRSRRACR